MSFNPTISVVITCYSEGRLLLDAVNSLLNQTLAASEIIIVNDASPDELTLQTCQELEKNPQIKIIWRSQNGGTSAARNDGFQAAIGDILVPLDADDLLPENSLKQLHNLFSTHPEAGFVYGSYIRQDQVNESGQVISPGEISLRQMLSPKPFSLSSQWQLLGTTPLRRSLWESIGGYDLTFGVDDLHDVEFWIRAIATGCPFQYSREPIYIWRKYLGSNSRRVTPLAWYRVAQKHLEIYCQLGLEYRAYELLLLGSKWLNQPQEIEGYSKELLRCIQAGTVQFSTLMALGIPAPVLQWMAARMSKKR